VAVASAGLYASLHPTNSIKALKTLSKKNNKVFKEVQKLKKQFFKNVIKNVDHIPGIGDTVWLTGEVISLFE